MFIEVNSKYGTGFEITEYNGTISLVSARQYKDKVYQKWGEFEIGKDKTKHLPVSVELGEGPDKAIAALRAAAEFIKAGKIKRAATKTSEDPPF